MGTPQARRGDTRRRIQDVALALFAEHGYEKTSLREIAENLQVTKAALYYHFKTKEDIVISLFEDMDRPLQELIAWAQDQPRTLERKQETVRRYSAVLHQAGPLFRFMQENQATVRELTIGQDFKKRMFSLVDLLREPDASMADQVRSVSALFTINAGFFVLQNIDGDPEEKQEAILEVALDLVTSAHRETRG